VTCPTLVIAGDADPWGSVDAAAEIVAALPDPLVRYEQFEGAGHHVHHDDPDRLFELLREFVAEPGQATAVPTRTHVAQPDRCSP
jgi:pimeloyl-ACP methyl ester carboxylesterase